MNRWLGRIAVVTGAATGMGTYICKDLLRAGMIVVGTKREGQTPPDMRNDVLAKYHDNCHFHDCDVTNDGSVKEFFQWVDGKFGRVDVLVNNAGVMRKTELVAPDNTKDMVDLVQTNILGVVYCTREAFNLMRLRGVNDGHVIVMNSASGHHTPVLGLHVPSLNIYPATKHAITSMVDVYREEFLRYGTKIRITSISPGFVDTGLFPAGLDIKGVFPQLNPQDVSNAVLYAIATPPDVEIHELTIKPLGELG